jgi:transcriptional regulator with XRE-family HTH domain
VELLREEFTCLSIPIARLESGRHIPSVNTLLKIASASGMHLVVGLADLPDFFVIREPPPWIGDG